MANADSASKPFNRGKTFYNGGTIDTSNYGGIILEGQKHTFIDADPDGTAPRSSALVTCEIVRNVSGINLLPGRALVYQAGQQHRRVDGYVTTNGAYIAGFVDEHLPSAGVPNGDLFYMVVDGPALVRTDLAGDALTAFSADAILVGATAATSQATTAGRVCEADLTGATSVLANQILNSIGRAMSANTTEQTNRLCLVDVNIKR